MSKFVGAAFTFDGSLKVFDDYGDWDELYRGAEESGGRSAIGNKNPISIGIIPHPLIVRAISVRRGPNHSGCRSASYFVSVWIDV